MFGPYQSLSDIPFYQTTLHNVIILGLDSQPRFAFYCYQLSSNGRWHTATFSPISWNNASSHFLHPSCADFCVHARTPVVRFGGRTCYDYNAALLCFWCPLLMILKLVRSSLWLKSLIEFPWFVNELFVLSNIALFPHRFLLFPPRIVPFPYMFSTWADFRAILLP